MNYFDKKILFFLRELTVNNNREWFYDNKALYEEAKALFLDFVSFQIAEIQKFDSNIQHINAKDCLFRIHRDIRFSQDKTPYKIHFGAYIAPGGRKSKYSGYYTHIESDNSMLAGGIHRPESHILKAIRETICQEPKRFESIIEDQQFKALFPVIYGEKLKSAPRGFSKDSPVLKWIQYKSYDFVRPISDEQLLSEDFSQHSIKVFKQLKTINDYFNNIVADVH